MTACASSSLRQIYLSLDGVLYAHDGCLCTLWVRHQGTFHLRCANPVAADIDYCMGGGTMKKAGVKAAAHLELSMAKLKGCLQMQFGKGKPAPSK